jgi:hypothetical protein
VPRVGPGAQEGKIVFHGTPHNFDEFDSTKIGSGEGTQAFGHGLYFAENPATAGTYKSRLTAMHPDIESAMADIASAGSKQRAVVALNKVADNSADPAERMFLRRKVQLIKSGAADPRGKLMHVDIPDEHIATMIDHDAPVGDQPPTVKMALEKAGVLGSDDPRMKTGGDAYAKLAYGLGGGQLDEKAASAYLSENGVAGIRFLDRGSRDSGEGTRNIVLFDAKHAKIVKKE